MSVVLTPSVLFTALNMPLAFTCSYLHAHVIRHKSHVTHHVSHVAHHTSHVTRHAHIAPIRSETGVVAVYNVVNLVPVDVPGRGVSQNMHRKADAW